MKSKLLIILLIAITLNLSAQEVNKNLFVKKYPKAFGVGAGLTTGLGLSFRYFPARYGFMVNFAPYYQNYGSEAFISSGLTLLYSLNDNKVSNVYAYLGNHYLYEKLYSDNWVYDPVTGTSHYYQSKNARNMWNTGIGLGVEFHNQKRITINFMLGYAQYDTFRNLFFTCEAALYYRFN